MQGSVAMEVAATTSPDASIFEPDGNTGGRLEPGRATLAGLVGPPIGPLVMVNPGLLLPIRLANELLALLGPPPCRLEPEFGITDKDEGNLDLFGPGL